MIWNRHTNEHDTILEGKKKGIKKFFFFFGLVGNFSTKEISSALSTKRFVWCVVVPGQSIHQSGRLRYLGSRMNLLQAFEEMVFLTVVAVAAVAVAAIATMAVAAVAAIAVAGRGRGHKAESEEGSL